VRRRIWAFAVGLISVAVMISVLEAQQNTSTEDPTAEVVDLRRRILQTNEDNMELIRASMFNLDLTSICLDDIDNMQDNLVDHLGRIVASIRIISQLSNLQDKSIVISYLKNDINGTIELLPINRKRVYVNATRICGSIPNVVKRAQIALSLLDEIERTLSRLKQRY
jgi:hypothetical protein